jgi:uncharacterized membrane protein
MTSAESLDRLEHRLGVLLKAGVLSSAASLAIGLATWFAAGPTTFSNGALTFGLLILMATPILRVVVSLVAYIRMRDWFFVGTTVAVFVLLAITVLLAWGKMKGAA